MSRLSSGKSHLALLWLNRKRGQFSKDMGAAFPFPLPGSLSLKICVFEKKSFILVQLSQGKSKDKGLLVRTLNIREVFYLFTSVYLYSASNQIFRGYYYLVLAFQNLFESFFLANKWKNTPLPIVHNVLCLSGTC